MNNETADAFVFFGATGDLAYKQILPALQALIADEQWQMPIIGVAKSGWDLDQLKQSARESVAEHGGIKRQAFDKLSSLLQYIDGDYRDQQTFTKIKQALRKARRPLYYLAIPPELFATVVEGLEKADCLDSARVVVEKPFGQDLASARQLNKILHRFFEEENIFRIDHFLGKEPVQNLVYFRFANPIVESLWNHSHVESVQITMAEKFGIGGRGKLYDQLGTIRDVVQNHLLQVIACLAMESPLAGDHNSLRNERGRLLKCVRPLDPGDVVRGQFNGYQKQEGVAFDSQMETFAALRLYIDNHRWQGVPFYVRAGKRLPVTATEVVVRFQPQAHPVLDELVLSSEGYYRFRLSPEQVIALAVKVKAPGESMVGECVEQVAYYQAASEMPPYQRLFADATAGDATLFAREDSVEASWRVVDPVLDDATPVYEYEPNTWGPPVVAKVVEPKGGWHNPKLDKTAVKV